jgi:hypothetical protein
MQFGPMIRTPAPRAAAPRVQLSACASLRLAEPPGEEMQRRNVLRPALADEVEARRRQDARDDEVDVARHRRK